MSEEDLLWCLDGDSPALAGLRFLANGGYHKAPFLAGNIDKLGIPGIAFADGPRGAVIGNGTCFPVAIARGATWNPELEERIGEAIGKELRSAGATITGAICVNLIRHPAWGRAQESYGEDPFHVGEMGAAMCRGLQKNVMACVKHFACNSMENSRFKVNIEVDEVTLHELFLPQFKRIVQEKVASVMTAYNSLNSKWCGENSELLTEILRNEWGFNGIVISDWIFGIRDAEKSVNAGLNIEMPYRMIRMTHLKQALSNNTVDISRVRQLVSEFLATLLRHSLIFTKPAPDITTIGCYEHRQLARESASASVVLLKNELVDTELVLPISLEISDLVVFGRLADSINLGDRGSSDVWDTDCSTIFEGIKERIPSVIFNDGRNLFEVEKLAASTNVAIVVVGYNFEDEGEFIFPEDPSLTALFPKEDEPTTIKNWKQFNVNQISTKTPDHLNNSEGGFGIGGDRDSLLLHQFDIDLIETVAKVNKRTIVVVQSGGAVIMRPWVDKVSGLIQAFYGGCRAGQGLADILFGQVNPSAKLPYSIALDQKDYPYFKKDSSNFIYDDSHGWWHLIKTKKEPTFSFGFGLSYTSFEIKEVKLALTKSNLIEITGILKNTGKKDGAEVIQVYAQIPERHPRLVGFKRLEVKAGTQTNFKVMVQPEVLAKRNPKTHSWDQPRGSYVLNVGRYATDPNAFQLKLTIDDDLNSGLFD